MLSYPDIRVALDAVIGMVELKANVKVAAQDLKFLCEFAIPVVVNCQHYFACVALALLITQAMTISNMHSFPPFDMYSFPLHGLRY